MVVYIALLIVLFSLRNEKKQWAFFLGLLLMFVISGFRGISVGTDTRFYDEVYSTFLLYHHNLIDVWSEAEPLYYSFFYFFKIWGLSFRWVLIVSSVLFLAPIAYILIKNDDKSVKSLLFLLLLGLYFFGFNGMRQAIAMSFTFAGCYYLEKKKIKIFIICLAIALGFHLSSIVALIFPLLRIVKFDKWLLITLLYVSYILPQIFDLLPLIFTVTILSDDFTNYAHYLDFDIINVGRVPIVGTVQTLLFTYIIFRNGKNEIKTDFYFKVSLFCIILDNLLYVSPSWASRIVLFFEMPMIVYYVRWCKRSTLDAILIYVYTFVNFIYYYLLLGTNGIIPYEFSLL